MSLRKRPIDPFKIVCLHDDALDGIPQKLLQEYTEKERDYSVIADAVAKLERKPVIFTCVPLQPTYDDIAMNPTAMNQKLIFATHVKAMDNVPDPEMVPKIVVTNDKTQLDMAYVNTIPLNYIDDIVAAIVKTGFVDTAPFTPQATFWRARNRRDVLRHASSLLTTASTDGTANDGNSSNA